jgi:hypothetical protein
MFSLKPKTSPLLAIIEAALFFTPPRLAIKMEARSYKWLRRAFSTKITMGKQASALPLI